MFLDLPFFSAAAAAASHENISFDRKSEIAELTLNSAVPTTIDDPQVAKNGYNYDHYNKR